MKRLDRYIIKEILKYFMIVLAVVIGIFVSVDYLGTMDKFLRAGMPLLNALGYVLLRVPFMVAQLIPAIILLTLIIVFGLMSRNNEVLILKSSGISVLYFLKSVLITGIVLGIFLFLLSEIVVPITFSKTNKIKEYEIKKKQSLVTSREKNVWTKGHRKITHIKYATPKQGRIFGIRCNTFDDNFNLMKRVEAKSGLFKNGKWILHDVMVLSLNKENNNYKTEFVDYKEEELDILPEDLKRVMKKSSEMGFTELLSYIRKVEGEGYDATKYRVDLHAKIAFPFACIIMSLIGIGVALKSKKHKSIPSIVTMGIGIAFFYWVLYSFCLPLGYGEILPPVVAAWTANIIFFCFGFYMILNVEYEER
jgi:lipopolysaccharide export system permease protein